MHDQVRRGTPHFKIKDAGKVEITEDDERIFLDLYRHGILDAHTIRQLLPTRSEDWLGRRLRKLTDAGYLCRPRQQRRLHKLGGGSHPLCYTLANGAARHLKARFNLPVRTDRWRTTTGALSSLHIEHSLEQGRFMVQLRLAVERHAKTMAFEYPDQIFARLKPALLKKQQHPLIFATRVNWHGWHEKESTIPDGFCALRYIDAPPEKSSRYLFIEIDRGTETIEPSARNLRGDKLFRGNSLLRKLVVYGQGFLAGSHTALFGIPTFQVLVVTTTGERVRQMIEAYQKHLTGPLYRVPPVRFLFVDIETLVAQQNRILTCPLCDGLARPITLLG
ncbi:replication-relaxation family protein [Allomesorhizobium camelthorni]|uniref:Replication-relaxation family protein n=1 Tax=Allomesorhizobium camelthorni TaxID=475069 RepID=A0A6G4WF89_9HYPH|nr:replication-relaxation family protein [Mesorhizobium camelthorni]NGO53475.1 hypothetical protein [Mesorhizobium camelthorni]